MAAAQRITTKVLPGGRVEVDMPGLVVGQSVDVLVIPHASEDQRRSFFGFLRSLPSRRSKAAWEKFEKDFQAERDGWNH
ncbi:MAG TPA: hypothetical protein VHX86_10100 [Tepidisphaeraceae bacterium]|jgi:hypothetical protein|nr:hypothetical protein [Tepidisphaeraceae bacterium]